MKKNIAYYIFVYWLLLLSWQNLFSGSLRGIADTVIKISLMIYLIYGFININGKRLPVKGTVLLFVFTMLMSLLLNDLFTEIFSFSIILFYGFPCIYVYLTYCMGHYTELCSDELRTVNKYVIFVTTIAVLYTAVFERAQFTDALTASQGYGNELHGFFTSMYEFALYLFYSIACCVREIDTRNKRGEKGASLYYLLMAIFMFTMVLTFSRTIIVCCIAYLIIYSLFNKQSMIGKVIILFGMVFIVLFMTVPELNTYVFQTIWKGGISNSRERLYLAAIEYYKSGTLIQKIFGRGIAKTRYFFALYDGYGSVHNGYLQVLLYYGWNGIVWMIVMAISQIKKIRRCLYYNSNLAIESFAFLVAALLAMLPSTVIIFNSPIDSFFLTTFMIVIPRFRMNFEIYST